MKMPEQIQAFFYKQLFHQQRQAEIGKKIKQHPEAKFSLFDDYLHSLYVIIQKNNKRYSKKNAKKQASVNLWDYAINHNENKDENEK